MEEAAKRTDGSVISSDEASIVVQPAKAAFDDPSAAIASQGAAIVPGGSLAIAAMWCDEGDTTLCEFITEGIGVESTVGDHALEDRGCAIEMEVPHLIEGGRGERGFGGGRSGNLNSERYTLAADQNHELRALSALSEPDGFAPFFAPEKDASRNASSRSRRSLALRTPSSARHTSFQTSWSSQRVSQRWTVALLGYSLGRSFQRAPVVSIHRMASSTLRGLDQGRPRPWLRRVGLGNSGSRIAHWRSVSILQQIPRRQTKYNTTEPNYETASRYSARNALKRAFASGPGMPK
jgi:hypothetical protein